MAKSQEITNPFEAIARVQWGWSASEIKSAIEVPTENSQKLRWYHTLFGAAVAWESEENFKFSRVARELVEFMEQVILAKDCNHVDHIC